MSLPFPIPPSAGASRSLRTGRSGLDVYALQLCLNDWLAKRNQKILVNDGRFGDLTEGAVRRYQGIRRLTEDGIAGQATQLSLIMESADEFEQLHGLPKGLLCGLVVNESLGYLGAVNDSVAGGKDLSAYQRRVNTADLGTWAAVGGAYDMRRQARLVSEGFEGVYVSLRAPKPGLELFGVHEGARGRWELATLTHNYPAAVEHLSRGETAWRFIEKDIVRYPNDLQVRDQPEMVSRLTTDPAKWVHDASGGRLFYVHEWCASYIKQATKFVVWA